MTFAGIFLLIAKGMPEATSNARLRAQLPKDGRHTSLTSCRPAEARARRRSFCSISQLERDDTALACPMFFVEQLMVKNATPTSFSCILPRSSNQIVA